jgi:hypothetical protein
MARKPQKILASTKDQIAALAKQFWEAEGRPEGKALEHWIRAEQKLTAKNGKPTNPENSNGSVFPVRI